MTATFDSSQWHDFGIAVTGASAALAGLLVVAVSINLAPIVAGEGLPRRAGGALITLATPIAFSVLLLVPGLPQVVLAWLLLVIGVACGLALGLAFAPSHRSPQQSLTEWLFAVVLPTVLLVIPILLAGVGLLTTTLGGLFWLPLAVVASVVGGLAHAWVLLIEILR